MKKIKIIGILIIFVLSILSHFMYTWFPNSIFSIIFPVNESIWEHMKLIVTPVFLFAIFEYILYRKKLIKYNNFILSYVIAMIVGIISYLILYLPVHYIFGHSTIYAIVLLFIIFVFVELVSYYIMNFKEIKYSNILGIVLIILIYSGFGYLTYNPLENDLFYDDQTKTYGM